MSTIFCWTTLRRRHNRIFVPNNFAKICNKFLGFGSWSYQIVADLSAGFGEDDVGVFEAPCLRPFPSPWLTEKLVDVGWGGARSARRRRRVRRSGRGSSDVGRSGVVRVAPRRRQQLLEDVRHGFDGQPPAAATAPRIAGGFAREELVLILLDVDRWYISNCYMGGVSFPAKAMARSDGSGDLHRTARKAAEKTVRCNRLIASARLKFVC